MVSLLINVILWSFGQNRSGPKVDLSVEKKHMFRTKKHILFGSRVVHFWTRIWSGRGDDMRVGCEVWDDCNTANRWWMQNSRVRWRNIKYMPVVLNNKGITNYNYHIYFLSSTLYNKLGFSLYILTIICKK